MGPDSSLTPELIQAQSFTTAFRGYDSAEVKSFLSRVSKELRAWRERAEQLESAWHSAEERAARPPVLDEDTLMAAVGEETAAILRTARAAATELRSKAADEAERALTDAREEAERTVTDAREEAERVLSHSRSEADRLLEEARSEASRLETEAKSALAAATEAAEEAAARILSSAREEAAGLVSRASSEAEEIRAAADKERQLTIEGANTTRDRILEDLSRRRRVATVQIEQLRAGRERLIESYAVVRRTLEEVQTELSRADTEARAAADEVGRRLQRQAEVELSEKEPSRVVVSDEERAEGADLAPAEGGTPGAEGAAHRAEVGAELAAAESAAAESAVVIPEGSTSEASSPAGEDTAAAASRDGAAEPAGATEPAGSEPAEAESEGVAGEPDAAPDASGGERRAVSDGAGRGPGGQAVPYDREVNEEEGPGSAVDELFARIRADRDPAGSGSTDEPSPADDQQPVPPYFAGARVAGSEGASARSAAGAQAAGGPAPEATGAAGSASGPVVGGPAPGPNAEGGPAGAAGAAGGRKSRKRSARAERSVAAGGASGSTPARTEPAQAGRSPAHPAATHSSVRVISAEGPTVDSGEPAADSPRSGRAGREPNSEEGAPRAATELETDRDDLVPDADEQLLQARELAVVELETSLTRRLKRALQDEQNDVLDRLRNLKEAPTVARLLPDADGHRESYVAAARPLLVDAATAGAAFAEETLGLEARPSAGAVEVEDLARECASSIVDALRRRLEQAMERGRGEDQSVLVDSLGAAYREWKTQRIERLAGDVLAGAFSRGTWTAAPDGALFRWVVEDVDGPCPDCDDDALAGSIPRNEPFPTGQPYPPAHSGCRCLLVPSLPGS